MQLQDTSHVVYTSFTDFTDEANALLLGLDDSDEQHSLCEKWRSYIVPERILSDVYGGLQGIFELQQEIFLQFFSRLTANEWKNWTLLFSLLTLHGILPQEHLMCWQLFANACSTSNQNQASMYFLQA